MVKIKTPAEAITNLIEGATAKWARQRKSEERDKSAYRRRRDVMTRVYRDTIKSVAYEVMESAYNKPSSNGSLPMRARFTMQRGLTF
jgi:hypothetical protein